LFKHSTYSYYVSAIISDFKVFHKTSYLLIYFIQSTQKCVAVKLLRVQALEEPVSNKNNIAYTVSILLFKKSFSSTVFGAHSIHICGKATELEVAP